MSAVAALANEDRASVYHALAHLLRPPEPGGAERLRRQVLSELRLSLGRLGADRELLRAAEEVAVRLREASPATLEDAWSRALPADPGGETRVRIGAGLEALHVLARRQATAERLSHGDGESRRCRSASRNLLQGGMARRGADLGRQLARAPLPLYAAVGRLLEGFLTLDAGWLGADWGTLPERGEPGESTPGASR